MYSPTGYLWYVGVGATGGRPHRTYAQIWWKRDLSDKFPSVPLFQRGRQIPTGQAFSRYYRSVVGARHAVPESISRGEGLKPSPTWTSTWGTHCCAARISRLESLQPPPRGNQPLAVIQNHEVKRKAKELSTKGTKGHEERRTYPMGFHYDDGSEFDPELVPKPGLCVTCRKDDDPEEYICCILTRADQQDEPEFRCYGYAPRNGRIDVK